MASLLEADSMLVTEITITTGAVTMASLLEADSMLMTEITVTTGDYGLVAGG